MALSLGESVGCFRCEPTGKTGFRVLFRVLCQQSAVSGHIHLKNVSWNWMLTGWCVPHVRWWHIRWCLLDLFAQETLCQKLTLIISHYICKIYAVTKGNNAPKRGFYSQSKWYFKGCFDPEVGVSMATVCFTGCCCHHCVSTHLLGYI